MLVGTCPVQSVSCVQENEAPVSEHPTPVLSPQHSMQTMFAVAVADQLLHDPVYGESDSL